MGARLYCTVSKTKDETGDNVLLFDFRRTMLSHFCSRYLRKRVGAPLFIDGNLKKCLVFHRSSRFFSASNVPQTPPWVLSMNEAISKQPVATVGSFAAIDALSIFAIYTLYSGAGLSVSADLAVAFGVSRLLRKVRLPVDLAAGALLARFLPSLAQVKLLPFFALGVQKGSPTGGIQKAMAGMTELVNRYGLAYMVASRCLVGPLSVGIIYTCISTGMDVQGALQGLDGLFLGSSVSASGVGNAAGIWAAAALTSAPLLPINLTIATAIGRSIESKR